MAYDVLADSLVAVGLSLSLLVEEGVDLKVCSCLVDDVYGLVG